MTKIKSVLLVVILLFLGTNGTVATDGNRPREDVQRSIKRYLRALRPKSDANKKTKKAKADKCPKINGSNKVVICHSLPDFYRTMFVSSKKAKKLLKNMDYTCGECEFHIDSEGPSSTMVPESTIPSATIVPEPAQIELQTHFPTVSPVTEAPSSGHTHTDPPTATMVPGSTAPSATAVPVTQTPSFGHTHTDPPTATIVPESFIPSAPVPEETETPSIGHTHTDPPTATMVPGSTVPSATVAPDI